MLIDFGLIPDEYDLQRRVYNFNKYVKKMKNGNFYDFDNIAFEFFSNHFHVDDLVPSTESESGLKILQTRWDEIYQKQMDKIRPWVKSHADELLTAVNNKLTQDTWDKYCLGTMSKWEMDSVSFYSHNHELENVDLDYYGFSDFFDLPEEPEVDLLLLLEPRSTWSSRL